MKDHYYTFKGDGSLFLLSKEGPITFFMRRVKKTSNGNWTGFWIAKNDLPEMFNLYNP